MHRLLRAAVFVAMLAAAGLGAEAPSIDPKTLSAHIQFLASDELQGRGNGSEGLERAAEYIAAQFKAAGLRPGSPAGDWFQPFELTVGLTVGKGNALAVEAGGTSAHLSLGESYFPLAVRANESNTTRSMDLDDVPLVFAGYGIVAPGFQYDDYAGLDVKDKAVLIFSHEPQESRRDSKLNGAQPLQETTLANKAQAARTRGARALLIVSDPSHRTDEANYRLFSVDSDVEDHVIPVLRVRRDEMEPLLKAWNLDRVAADIDRDLTPRSRPLANATIDYTQRLELNRRTVRNVIGVLAGSDQGKTGEAVVLGGHYDHVGLGGRLSSTPERTGEIHNGADDNASGVAALIEIARAAAADRSRFRRSLVFIAFAGEERGLLGSEYYASHPAIPLANTVAMLNLDMVGRAHGKVEVGGLTASTSLAKDVEAAARTAGIDARPGGPGAGRSDDSSFINQRIPSLHFFTGFHDDYHRPSDDWDRIDAPGTARVAKLVLEIAARVATQNDRPQFSAR